MYLKDFIKIFSIGSHTYDKASSFRSKNEGVGSNFEGEKEMKTRFMPHGDKMCTKLYTF